jgi:hypothetical protein
MSNSLLNLGGASLSRPSQMVMNDMDNSFDNSNSFDIPEASLSPGGLKKSLSVEDHAALGDDMDFLLNGGFDELSSKEKKSSSSSGSKSKSKSKSSRKSSGSSKSRSSRNRSSKDAKDSTNSSFDVSSPLRALDSSTELESSSKKFEFGLEDVSTSSVVLEKSPATFDMDVSSGSMGKWIKSSL